MFQITYEDLIYIHDQIILKSGGLPGIRDENVIRSALERPYQSAFNEETYPDLFEKAAAILESIANNHGFLDGNKRTAMAAAAVFLFTHNIELRITNEEYEEFMLKVVNDKPSITEIKSWLQLHCDIIV